MSPLLRTLAALADAHDEHMLLVRTADMDTVDNCELQEELFRLLVINLLPRPLML